MNRVTALVVVLLLSVTACGSAAPTATTATTTQLTAERLPSISLTDLDSGAAVDLAKLTGPAVINLFATWCGPCKTELPVFAQAAKALGDRVTFIGSGLEVEKRSEGRRLAADDVCGCARHNRGYRTQSLRFVRRFECCS